MLQYRRMLARLITAATAWPVASKTMENAGWKEAGIGLEE